MLTSYKILFTCKVMHTFFADNICRGVAFKPGKATQEVTRRFEMLIIPSTNGFSMLVNSSNAIPDLLNYVTNVTGYNYFDFELTIDDSSFNNYTEVPVNWVGQFQFSSGNVASQTGETILLKTVLSDTSPRPRGVFNVFFNDIVHTASQPPIYTMQFNARLTQWDYYVILRTKNVDQANLRVRSKDSIRVNGPQQTKTASGEAAVLFKVDKLIPLSETPKHSFDLIIAGDLRNSPGERYDRVLYKGLPAPGKSNIGITTDGKNTLVTSPMYVYI